MVGLIASAVADERDFLVDDLVKELQAGLAPGLVAGDSLQPAGRRDFGDGNLWDDGCRGSNLNACRKWCQPVPACHQ